MQPMNPILIWDIPTRIFHWAFAASVTAAMGIGLWVDDEQSLFQWHMLFGIVALFLLVLRVVMGIVGSRHSRFASFPLRPREVVHYMASAVFSKTKRYAGNNPGSALAAILMFLLVPALFISGIGVGGEPMEEIHETLAWALLAIVVLHLSGIAWHTIRHRENIALSMVTGKKAAGPEDGIRSSHPLLGLGLLLLAGAWIAALFSNHDARSANVRIPVIGTVLHLGENESGENKHDGDERRKGHHDDD